MIQGGGWLIIRDGRLIDWVDIADTELPRFNSRGLPLAPGDDPFADQLVAVDQETLVKRFARGPFTRMNVEEGSVEFDKMVDEALIEEIAAANGVPYQCDLCELLGMDLGTELSSIEGVVTHLTSDSDECICCDGPHIFSRMVTDAAGHPVDVNELLYQAVLKLPAGSRVRITIDAIPE